MSGTGVTGSVGIADLADLPEELLEALSDGAIAQSCPTRWAFLDTETTGLAAQHLGAPDSEQPGISGAGADEIDGW